jgi:hypothetical protein
MTGWEESGRQFKLGCNGARKMYSQGSFPGVESAPHADTPILRPSLRCSRKRLQRPTRGVTPGVIEPASGRELFHGRHFEKSSWRVRDASLANLVLLEQADKS